LIFTVITSITSVIFLCVNSGTNESQRQAGCEFDLLAGIDHNASGIH
jgi:hypothetical protein